MLTRDRDEMLGPQKNGMGKITVTHEAGSTPDTSSLDQAEAEVLREASLAIAHTICCVAPCERVLHGESVWVLCDVPWWFRW